MEQIPISKFKATCLAVLERVRQTGEPVVVTRRGQPVAEVIAPRAPVSERWLGRARDTGRVVADIVGPTRDLASWEAEDAAAPA